MANLSKFRQIDIEFGIKECGCGYGIRQPHSVIYINDIEVCPYKFIIQVGRNNLNGKSIDLGIVEIEKIVRRSKIMKSNNGTEISISDYNVDMSEVHAIARLLEAKHVETAQKQEDKFVSSDFPIVVLTAWGEGMNPLSDGFYYWKYGGAITVSEKYTAFFNWAQNYREPFSIHERYGVLEGIGGSRNEGDIICTSYLITEKDKSHLGKLIAEKLQFLTGTVSFDDPDKALAFMDRVYWQALSQIATKGYGVVEHREYTYNDGNINTKRFKQGWTPEKLCAKRGGVAAVRNRFGEPTPAERRAIEQNAIDQTRRYAQISESTTLRLPEHIQRVAQIEDGVEGYAKKVSDEEGGMGIEVAKAHRKKRFNERVNEMRGEEEGPIDAVFSEDIGFSENPKSDLKNRLNMLGVPEDAIENVCSELFNKTFYEIDDGIESSLLKGYFVRIRMIKDKKTKDIPEFSGSPPKNPGVALKKMVAEMLASSEVFEEV